MPARVGSARRRASYRLAMPFPVDNWQFWVVTAACVLALAAIVRALLPAPLRRKSPRGARATLTIAGRPPTKPDARGKPPAPGARAEQGGA